MCPECFKSAARQAATRAADYLTGCYSAWLLFGRNLGYINHIELSVPESQYRCFDKNKMTARAIKYSKQIGISGGGIVFHAFRIKKEYQRPIQQAIRAAGKKMGSWDGVRENILGLPSPEDYIVFSPHFHVVGFFRLKQSLISFIRKLVGRIRISVGVKGADLRIKKACLKYTLTFSLIIIMSQASRLFIILGLPQRIK